MHLLPRGGRRSARQTELGTAGGSDKDLTDRIDIEALSCIDRSAGGRPTLVAAREVVFRLRQAVVSVSCPQVGSQAFICAGAYGLSWAHKWTGWQEPLTSG